MSLTSFLVHIIDMAGKEPKQGSPQHSASEYRYPSQQAKYREQSKSEYKDTKEAAHIVSGQISKAALTDYRAPGRPPKDEAASVKEVTNAFSNLRMVDRGTNRSDHVKTDNALVRKAESGEPLTIKEETRARQQVAVLQENQDKLDKVTYQSYKNLYDPMQTKSGKTVWDGTKDKADKR